MTKLIAFLKAINVGGHTVKMDHLKKLFAKMGFENVETFIASGNVVFETKSKSMDAIKKKIEKELERSLSYKVSVFIRTTKELKEISDYNPFKESEPINKNISLYIAFLEKLPAEENLLNTIHLQDKANEFRFNNKELYWLCRKNFSDSGITGKTLEKTLGMETTIRGFTTVKKIIARFC